MDFSKQTDVRDRVGYSIDDPVAKASWIALVTSIRQYFVDNALQDKIVFHGTSQKRAKKILAEGMKPTDVSFAVWDQCEQGAGSFWGSIDAAVSYAEDTASERDPGSKPVLLAVRLSDLEQVCDLRCDGASLDFPLKGLTRLSEPEIEEKWSGDISLRSWKESLFDLGAVVAIHDDFLEIDFIEIVDDFEILKEMQEKTSFSP
jgi:hypothetical protein